LFAVNIRNLALEKVAEQVEFPCRFTGCTALMTAGYKTEHEKLCDFRFVSNFTHMTVSSKLLKTFVNCMEVLFTHSIMDIFITFYYAVVA